MKKVEPAKQKKAKASKKVKAPKPKKQEEEGRSVESFIIERPMDLKSVEEYLGMKTKSYTKDKPVIPGIYDLVIPPGVSQKTILKLAKEYGFEIVSRDDIYVPIGVSELMREILCIRGDEKTIKKAEKLLLEELEKFVK